MAARPAGRRARTKRGGGGDAGMVGAKRSRIEAAAEGVERGRIYLPELAHLGNHGQSVSLPASNVPPNPSGCEERNAIHDVYELKARSQPHDQQSQLSVEDLLSYHANLSSSAGRATSLAATRSISSLRVQGQRILSLYEVLVFTYHWHSAVTAQGIEVASVGIQGWELLAADVTPSPPSSESGGGWSQVGDDRPQAIRVSEAMEVERELLVVISGSREGIPPSLPLLGEMTNWVVEQATCRPFVRVIDGLHSYAEAKVRFVVEGLLPSGPEERIRAERAVRSGIGFSQNVASVKSLQIALASNVLPHDSAGQDFKVAGYGIKFHDTANDGHKHTSNGRRRPHPHTSCSSGMYVGLDGPHEKNHDADFRRKYAGLSQCSEISGVKLDPHEQDNSFLTLHVHTLSNMTLEVLTYSLQVIYEVRNEAINREILMRIVRNSMHHRKGGAATVCAFDIWIRGRCFCNFPLMRVSDRFGRVSVVSLRAVLKQRKAS